MEKLPEQNVGSEYCARSIADILKGIKRADAARELAKYIRVEEVQIL